MTANALLYWKLCMLEPTWFQQPLSTAGRTPRLSMDGQARGGGGGATPGAQELAHHVALIALDSSKAR